MTKLFYSATLLVVLLSISDVHSQADVRFMRCAQDALERYPGWIRQNNLDPTPVTPGPLDIYVEGFSEPVAIYDVWGDASDAKLSLKFETVAGNTSVKLTGDYSATGKISSSA